MKKIIIIDNNYEDRSVYQRFLANDSNNNYEVFEASYAVEGIKLCQELHPDCIILDYNLPDLKAIEVIDRIREFMETPTIIVSAGQGSESIAVEVMQNGVQDYITKSVITKEDLRRSVGNAIERASLKRAIRTREKELRIILHNMIDGVILINRSGTIQSANPSAATIFNYNDIEMAGMNIRMLLDEYDADAFAAHMEQYHTSGGNEIIGNLIEIKGKSKDGSIFPLEFGISAIESSGETKFVVTLKDITARKEREKSIQFEQERADQANKAKSMFLATMSHEIRTPINGIIGASELLLLQDLEKETRLYAETIHTSGELLFLLVNDILDFSKIEAGELTLESSPVEFDTLLTNVMHILSPRANDNNVELALQCGTGVPFSIITDPMRLNQILINLIGNAIKFTADGDVMLIITKLSEKDQKALIRFEIQDTGVGIAEDKLESIFEQFLQADSSITRKFGGTGLGLAISKRLIEMLGGSIHVRSTLGVGTVFWFDIEFDIDTSQQPKKIIHSSELFAEIRHKRVLLIDDQDINLKILAEYFKNFDMKPDKSINPCDALEMIKKAHQNNEPYDLVIVDYMMPEMNGEQLGRIIKDGASTYGSPKMVLMSAMGKTNQLTRLDKALFCDSLIKPVLPSLLASMLKNILLEDSLSQSDESTKPSAHTMATGLPIQNQVFSKEVLPQFDAYVLIAEDFAPNQKIITGMVKKLGGHYDLVQDGQQAVDCLEANPSKYQLVFMDCQMPLMDGFTATEEIRKKTWGKDITIVALTANALVGDKEKCFEAGMNDYLSKPVKLANVVEIFQRHL